MYCVGHVRMFYYLSYGFFSIQVIGRKPPIAHSIVTCVGASGSCPGGPGVGVHLGHSDLATSRFPIAVYVLGGIKGLQP